jgi:hypothetical protein
MRIGRLRAPLAVVALLLARAGASNAGPIDPPAAPTPLPQPTPPAAASSDAAGPSGAPTAFTGGPTAPTAPTDAPAPAASTDAAATGADAPPADPAPADPASPRQVAYADDALSVHVRQRPLADVIDEVARQTGATVKGSLKNPRDVSADFDAVPLADALGRLLGGDQNFALIYGGDGKLRTLRLLGSVDAQRASGATRVPAGPTAAGVQQPQATPASLAEVMAKTPIPLSGRLAQALGPQAQLSDLITAGLRNEDPSIRAEAVQTAIRTIENNSEMRSAVMGTLQGMDDAHLATMVRGMAADHGEEFLIQAAGHARHGDLRAKTQQILQQYRLQPEPGG